MGTTLYGQSDYDAHTNSYETTLYFVVLLVPIIPLARYRVIKNDNAYTFLGKVPFKFDRWYLGMILVLAVGFGVLLISDAITNYTRSNYSESSQTENNVEESKDNDLSQENPSDVEKTKSFENIEILKQKLEKQKSELEKLSEKHEIYLQQIELLASKANKMKNDNRLGITVSKSEYKNTVKRHNYYVNLYNKNLKEHKLKYDQNKRLVDKLNSEIDKYNEIIKNQ